MENKAFRWIYAQNSWTIPKEGEEGFIEEKSEESLGVLTVIKDDSVDGNDIPIIELKPRDGILLNEQLWVRSMICDNGYFTLENTSTGAVLTACDGPWSKIKEYRASELEGLHWVSTYLHLILLATKQLEL